MKIWRKRKKTRPEKNDKSIETKMKKMHENLLRGKIEHLNIIVKENKTEKKLKKEGKEKEVVVITGKVKNL